MTKKLKTKKETAEIMAVSPRKVEQLKASGKLPFVRIDGSVRFDEADIVKFIEANRVPSVPDFVCS